MTSLEEIIAFNHEVSSLTRAGVPIDVGWSQLSRDPDVASSQISSALAQRVHNGVPLADALCTEDLPRIYQCVVGVGLRCERLPAALEALSQYTQSLLNVRQSLRMAFVYPLIVCVLAYLLFVASCLFVAPESYPLVDIGRDWLPFWIAMPPVLLIAMLLVAFRSNSSRTTWSRSLPWVYRCLPGVSQVIADQRCASLAEVLALLVKHEVPLHEGLRLATGVSGNSKLKSAAEQVADAAERGKPLTQDSHAAKQFPPFLRWVLTSPTETGDLARMLQLAARTYRNRAERRTKWIRTATPMLTCVVVAGGVTLLYCLSVFGPLVQLIKDLS